MDPYEARCPVCLKKIKAKPLNKAVQALADHLLKEHPAHLESIKNEAVKKYCLANVLTSLYSEGTKGELNDSQRN